jgi:hypothetical protein
MATPTNGINADIYLNLDTDPSHTLALSLSGTNTHQIVPVLKDGAGTTQTATQSVTYVSRNASVATVSGSGLITGVKRGSVIVEAAYPFGNNSIGNGADGLPVVKIHNEIAVTVGV